MVCRKSMKTVKLFFNTALIIYGISCDNHRVTHLGSHLMNDSEKQDVLTARTQGSKAYEVSKLHTFSYIYYQLPLLSSLGLQTCSCSRIRVQ